MSKKINTAQFRGSVEENEGVVVVDFFATWCGPCKMLAPVFDQVGEEMKEQAKFVKVDIDESLEIARQFNISTVPTVMIFKNGKPVDSMVGFMPKDKMLSKIKSHL